LTPNLRIGFLNLASEIWLLFTEKLENCTQLQDRIFQFLRQTSKDRVQSVRAVSAINMFKLTEAFA